MKHFRPALVAPLVALLALLAPAPAGASVRESLVPTSLDAAPAAPLALAAAVAADAEDAGFDLYAGAPPDLLGPERSASLALGLAPADPAEDLLPPARSPALAGRLPGTRVKAFEFLGGVLIGETDEVTGELRWGSGEFGLGIAEAASVYAFVGWGPERKSDPMGLMSDDVAFVSRDEARANARRFEEQCRRNPEQCRSLVWAFAKSMLHVDEVREAWNSVDQNSPASERAMAYSVIFVAALDVSTNFWTAGGTTAVGTATHTGTSVFSHTAVTASEDLLRFSGRYAATSTPQVATHWVASSTAEFVTQSTLRSLPASFMTYRELRAAIGTAGLSGRGIGLEAHHLVQKVWAHLIGVAEDDILSVAVTPLWHRGVGKVGGANIDRLVLAELKKLGSTAGNAGVSEIWAAHRNVYIRLGQRDWADAIFKAYFEKRGLSFW